MQEPPEIRETTTSSVRCDGNGGALGHPAVYLAIDPAKGYAECPYCDRRFILAKASQSGTH